MKKVFSILLVTVLIVSMMGSTAFAHGGHGRHKQSNQDSRYALCTVDECDELGRHQHDDVWYCSPVEKQESYAVCTVDDCTELGLHQHNGEYYYCQNHDTDYGCGRHKNR